MTAPCAPYWSPTPFTAARGDHRGCPGVFTAVTWVDLNGPDARRWSPAGVVAYDAAELATMIGRSTSELSAELRRPAVHADDLVAV